MVFLRVAPVTTTSTHTSTACAALLLLQVHTNGQVGVLYWVRQQHNLQPCDTHTQLTLCVIHQNGIAAVLVRLSVPSVHQGRVVRPLSVPMPYPNPYKHSTNCPLRHLSQNWRRGSAEALSAWFLIEWLVGDSTNLVGCLLTHQLTTQRVTAFLFVGMDAFMLSQYTVSPDAALQAALPPVM